MEIGFAGQNVPPFSLTNPRLRHAINMDFDYKPGFQVSFGWKADYDGWDIHTEYTWFHNTQHQSSNGLAGNFIIPHWAIPSNEFSNVYNTANAHWRLKLDAVDVDMGRWMYVGTKFVARPFVGARAAWIRQNLNVHYVNTGTPISSTSFLADNVVNFRSTSWAIGPRAGMNTNWNLGAGFRIFGNGSADLLFTRYNRLSRKVTNVAFSATTQPVGSTTAALTYIHDFEQRRLNYLRTHLDMDLGIGWGTYWDCNNWYTDIALGYEFQVFFDQNMFRHADFSGGNSFSPDGNLYIHGLTAKFRLDF